MDTVVQHLGGLRVESAWIDADGLGERQWNVVRGLGAVERWCTTSELQVLLREVGFDIADLAIGVSLTGHRGGPAGLGTRQETATAASCAAARSRVNSWNLRVDEPEDDVSDDVDDECE